MTSQGRVAAANNDEIAFGFLSCLDKVASYVRIQRLGCGEGQASGVGKNVKGREVLLELRLERFDRPFGEHRSVVNGLGARGVIIQDNDFTLACADLFTNEWKDLLRPFGREVTKQVFFVDGFALQDFIGLTIWTSLSNPS